MNAQRCVGFSGTATAQLVDGLDAGCEVLSRPLGESAVMTVAHEPLGESPQERDAGGAVAPSSQVSVAGIVIVLAQRPTPAQPARRWLAQRGQLGEPREDHVGRRAA